MTGECLADSRLKFETNHRGVSEDKLADKQVYDVQTVGESAGNDDRERNSWIGPVFVDG